MIGAMIRITLDLTDDEVEALVGDVTFDAGTAENAGGHPASSSLLRKIRESLAGPANMLYDDEEAASKRMGRNSEGQNK